MNDFERILNAKAVALSVTSEQIKNVLAHKLDSGCFDAEEDPISAVLSITLSDMDIENED
ncbi:hypothetical protein V8132_001925 [Vibrio parahaemolyticus]